MILHDFHFFMNMLPLPDEDEYRNDLAILLENKYFTKVPWIENNGMSYISGTYESKTFTSFSHSVSKIINSILAADMELCLFDEYHYDVGLIDVYNNKGFSLSMHVIAIKK